MSESPDKQTYDLVVFGATSFVGKILCKTLLERHGVAGELRWAIAGRSSSKLSALSKELGVTLPEICADATDEAAMRSLVQSTRLVISTVGPYALYGSTLVEAAAKEGTDYCDLTGEPHWMAQMIDAHQDSAQASGARILHACGFDSIPSDLGVWFLQEQAHKQFGQYCSQVKMGVKSIRGGISGGTAASMLALMERARDPKIRKVLGNPYALGVPGDRKGPRVPVRVMPRYDEEFQSWMAPFVMAATNTKVVNRSHSLLGRPWGDNFVYTEESMMGDELRGRAQGLAMGLGLGAFVGAASLAPTRQLLKRFLPAPGEGPSPEEQQKGRFDLRFVGTSSSQETTYVKVTGDRDPGYGCTARMLAECAVTLLKTPQTELVGGFWTPATALGNKLIDALQAHAGMGFSVESSAR